MINCDSVLEAVAAYDPDAHEADLLKAEEQRAALLARFPKDGWPDMTLDRYALGRSDHPENFCRWMEFVVTELGSIKGGNARKHLIYFQAAAQEWWFDRKSYATVEEAWEAVRAGFVKAIELAEAGEWGAIEAIAALHPGPALLNKTLSAYFPDQLLPINSQAHLRHFLHRLGDPDWNNQELGTTRLNRRLLEGLRSCKSLGGWTTTQMEWLLYSSDLSPVAATFLAGPIADVAAFIANLLNETGSDERLELRREAEDKARRLLDDFAGVMTEAQARELFKLFNADFDKGKRTRDRFTPAFMGQTANGLVTHLEKFNFWTARMWKGSDEESAAALATLLTDRKALPSAGTAYPTMLEYLRSPETAAIWLRTTDGGLQRLTAYKPKKAAGLGGSDDYQQFCAAASQLMADYDIPPELLDNVLAAAAHAVEPRGPETSSERVWLFQANPTIYDIDHALSELTEVTWVVRQSKNEVRKGDFVYLWRSGPDAGIVATATVMNDPVEMPGDADDPYVIKAESLSKPEPRVVLRIDSVLPAVIRRSDLVEHSVLKDLGVVRFANATNFKVTPQQDQALRALLAGAQGMPPLRAEIEDRVFLPLAWLQEAVDLLEEKGQVVFYGPPGTGKTFVALVLAEEITRDGGQFRIVQFHPSYSYEDFVGGFRPVEDDGAHGVRYRRTDGPLRELAAAAASDPAHPYVLIVDEINRGNIPKIFGELLFLLEYRQKAIRLQYWPEEDFSLPSNLFIIGTMNTADRSIALVDAALRRRFYFVPFIPTLPPVSNVLDRWLKSHNFDDEAARLLGLLNEEIARDEVAIGPSYFMTDPKDGPDLGRIWDRAIMPLLEEYYYGTTWEPEIFALHKLRARLIGAPGGEVEEAGQAEADE